jgi:geranylgeranyl pyrophosphate synthase
MLTLVQRLGPAQPMGCLEYPLKAAQAVGGEADQALPGAAAIFCMLTSINLVDDLLDEDPRGEHHRLGVGAAANLALAFQALSCNCLQRSGLSDQDLAAAQSSLAEMALATAYGQYLDTGQIGCEDDYWRVVQAKTPPLFASALYLGALLGGGSQIVARSLSELGGMLGKIVQINDDVSDALHVPAKPDWRVGSANLPILYASLADHPQRAEFLELLPQATNPRALAAAQEILIRCGAISYCFYQTIAAYQQAKQTLNRLALPFPQPMTDLLDEHMQPLLALLRRNGTENPEALLQAEQHASMNAMNAQD